MQLQMRFAVILKLGAH